MGEKRSILTVAVLTWLRITGWQELSAPQCTNQLHVHGKLHCAWVLRLTDDSRGKPLTAARTARTTGMNIESTNTALTNKGNAMRLLDLFKTKKADSGATKREGGPRVKTGPTRGEVRARKTNGQWRAKRNDAGTKR